jgi:hypothetical protein
MLGRTDSRLRLVLLLGVFAMAPILLLGWGLALAVYYMGYQLPAGILAVLIVSAFSTLGNFAAFFEVAAATRLDGSRNRVRLLPFLFFGFLVSLMAVSQESLKQFFTIRRSRYVKWDKTERYWNGSGRGVGNGNGNGNASSDDIGHGEPAP